VNPYLTSRGRWVLVSGVIYLLVGASLSHPLIVILGQIQLALLAVAFMLLVPGALILDRRRVTLAVRAGEEVGEAPGVSRHIAGESIEVDVAVTNPTPLELYGARLLPYGADALELEPPEEAVDVPGGYRVDTSFTARADRCGRWTMHGFDVEISDPLGLIEARDYLPCTHHFECYAEATRRARAPRGARAARNGAGRQSVARMGTGTELMELREHQSGDPLRAIAWKATARQRKLISKSYEHEVNRSLYVLLDISTSMRGGQSPGQKLDYAIEETAALARDTLERRDGFGLMTFDEKLHGHIPTGTSRAHLRRVLHHLVGLQSIVDPGLTEFDDAELRQSVVDYLLVQERLDFRKGEHVDPISGINERLLSQWLRGVLPTNRRRYDSVSLHEGLGARDELSPLRRFAQLRGIEVPYRVEARLGMKERGLAEALEALYGGRRGSKLVVVISDLCGVMNMELLTRTVRMARLQGHHLSFVVPFTPSFYEEGDERRAESYRILKELFTSAEREERLRIVGQLRKLGVEVRLAAPASE
jgi:uncharacterized protein (DUF58 family)